MPLVTVSFLAKAVFKGSVCIALYYGLFVMAPGFAFTAATIVVAEVRTTIEEHDCSSIVLLFSRFVVIIKIIMYIGCSCFLFLLFYDC